MVKAKETAMQRPWWGSLHGMVSEQQGGQYTGVERKGKSIENEIRK